MNLIFQLAEEQWGKIEQLNEECPGVFYVATNASNRSLCREMYVVTQAAVPSVISKEALTYGKKTDGIYIFECDMDGNGWEVIDYEIVRYKTKCGVRMDEGKNLYSSAINSADRYPDYFGGHIPPRCTQVSRIEPILQTDLICVEMEYTNAIALVLCIC